MEPVGLGILTGVCLGFFPVGVTKFLDEKHVREEMLSCSSQRNVMVAGA